MIITYQGVQSFKVQFGDTVLAFDPISKESCLIGGQGKIKAASFGADIALVSLNHPDMNGVEQANRGEKQAFVIKGPGEYEVQGVFVKAVSSVSNYGGEQKINTIYRVNLEGMNICFLGALGDSNISTEAKENFDGIDILFVPIGGGGILNPHEAYKFAVSLEPSIIVPMNFDEKSLAAFLKEGGDQNIKPIDKLVIKKKDLEDKEGEIIVLEAQS